MPLEAGEDALEERAFAADRQRRRDPRLQDAVAFDDPAGGGVEARPVERMRHLADQPPHRVARQPRVGVERDDVADVGGHRGRDAIERDEGGVVGAAQQPVQLVQLAALAFPADPARLRLSFQTRRRCSSRKRGAAGCRSVALVQPRDAVGGGRQQRFVAVDVLGVGASRQSDSSAK